MEETRSGRPRGAGGGWSDPRRRRGFADVLHRVVDLLFAERGRSRVAAGPPLPALPSPDLDVARERARRALSEARREMTGLIGDDQPSMGGVMVTDAAVASPDLERLRSYLEESERERASLREELAGLRTALTDLRARVENLPARSPSHEAAPAAPHLLAAPVISRAGASGEERAPIIEPAPVSKPAATATDDTPVSAPPTEVGEMAAEAEGVEATGEESASGSTSVSAATAREDGAGRPVQDRLFAGGTVGVRVEFRPAPLPETLAAMVERLNEEHEIEHAVTLTVRVDGAIVRLTLRSALRWEQLRPLLERAIPGAFTDSDVRWRAGVLRVPLRHDPEARPKGGEGASLLH